eukprot:jgi/Mesvir1/4859/Mv11133-RA.1
MGVYPTAYRAYPTPSPPSESSSLVSPAPSPAPVRVAGRQWAESGRADPALTFVRRGHWHLSPFGSNTKRGVPFQLPSVIHPKKTTKRGDIKDTACSVFRPYPQETPLVARSLFTTPGKAHLESSRTSKMGVFEKETLPDSQPEPLSDSLVDTPELGSTAR